MPQISVIVPVYKVEPYLHRCVDSILAQTFTDFGLILVDDGSPDNCGKICDEYAEKDSRIKVIHKENSGVSSARNFGISAATGDYIAFCDSDDYYYPEALEKLLSAAKLKKADYVVANFSEASKQGEKPTGGIIKNSEYPLINPKEKYNFIIEKLIGKHGQWAVWGSLYKKQIIDDNKLVFCQKCNNYAEDIAFNINYILHCNSIAEITDTLYFYNDARDNSMMKKSENRYRLNDVNEAAFSIEQNYSVTFNDTYYDDLFCFIQFLLMYCEYSKIIRDDDLKQIPHLINKINKREWLIKNTKKLIGQKIQIEEVLDSYMAIYIVSLARYIVDGKLLKYRVSFFIQRYIRKFSFLLMRKNK